MLKMCKVCKAKQVKTIRYFFFHFIRYFSKWKLVKIIHLDPYPLRTFNVLYAVFTCSLNLRIFTERGTCP